MLHAVYMKEKCLNIDVNIVSFLIKWQKTYDDVQI